MFSLYGSIQADGAASVYRHLPRVVRTVIHPPLLTEEGEDYAGRRKSEVCCLSN